MAGVKIGGSEPPEGSLEAINQDFAAAEKSVQGLRQLLDAPSVNWAQTGNPEKPDLGQRNRWEWFKDYFCNMLQMVGFATQMHEMDGDEAVLKQDLASALNKYEYRSHEFADLRAAVADATATPGMDADARNRSTVLLLKLEDQKNKLVHDVEIFTGQAQASGAQLTR